MAPLSAFSSRSNEGLYRGRKSVAGWEDETDVGDFPHADNAFRAIVTR